MSTIAARFDIYGIPCFIETTDGDVAESRATLYVEVDGRVITDAYGYCSPLYAAYSGRDGWKFARLHGAARQSMIRHILRTCVYDEIDAHINYCWQLVESGELNAATGRETGDNHD